MNASAISPRLYGSYGNPFNRQRWISMMFLALILWLVGCSSKRPDTGLQQPAVARYTVAQIASQHGLDPARLHAFLRHLSPSASGLLLSPLAGGMTSTSVYEFTLSHRAYVLRFFSPRQDLLARKNEVLAHSFAASMDLAPEVHFIDPEWAFIVMDRIQGRPLTPQDLQSPAHLIQIGQMLARLAAYEGPFSQVRTQSDRVRKHADRAKQNNVAFPSIYSTLYADYQRNQAHLASLGRVLCHGDLNPSNVWITPQGRFYWIDWTSASWDHPYADLGYFSMAHGLSSEESAVLLQGYLGDKASADQWADFSLAQRQVAFLTATTWFDFSESLAEKSIPLALRVERLDKAWANPSLPDGRSLGPGGLVSVRSEDKSAIKQCALSFLKTFYAGSLKEPLQP